MERLRRTLAKNRLVENISEGDGIKKKFRASEMTMPGRRKEQEGRRYGRRTDGGEAKEEEPPSPS